MRIVTCPLRADAAVLSLALLCYAFGETQPNLGTFKVNGKDANLSYAGLVAMKPISGVPRMILVLAEKVPAPGADLALLSYAGGLGASVSAPMLKYPDEGWSVPSGFDYTHPAAKNGRGCCSIASCMPKDVVIKDGEFRAQLVSAAPPSASGDSIVLDVPLRIKMPRRTNTSVIATGDCGAELH